MKEETWSELKEKAREKFSDFKEEKREEVREDDVGNKINYSIEVLEFTSPLGKTKVERIVHPKIIDRKTHYHHGAGGAKAQVELITADDEFTSKIRVYKQDEFGEWEELKISPDKINF